MGEPFAIFTFAIILLTVVVSYTAFRNGNLEHKHLFDPRAILADKEYYRLVTSAFVHVNGRHLALNMVSLYLFGSALEYYAGPGRFLLIYFGSIIGGSLLSLYVHRHHDYRACGASGGVCGVIFAHILLFAGGGIYLFPLPLAVPGWLYAIGFMLGSFYGMKTHRDNVGHDAHLGGAILGFLLTAALFPDAARANWTVFALVLAITVPLLIYLWRNPMFLPLAAFEGKGKTLLRRKANKSALPKYKQEALEMDAILEKISREGMESLNEHEKKLLSRVSEKYRRRAESEKPKSDLAI